MANRTRQDGGIAEASAVKSAMMTGADFVQMRKGEPMVDKELIEIWRNTLKPSISSRLLKTNYEGMGEQDKEEFECDFDEILDLALIGLKYKAQLSQEGTTSDLISRQAAIDAVKHAWAKGLEPSQYIEELPSAQANIIACGDCKYWICHDRRCGFWNHGVKPLDWCSYAERRNE